MKSFVLLFVAGLITAGAHAQARHTFEIKAGNFQYDGKPIYIHSGEMHFARVPHQYWRHRLRMMKAMGLNTVATYVFWNFHEPSEGQWNFSGDHDIASFIKTAGEEGLMVECGAAANIVHSRGIPEKRNEPHHHL